VTDTNINSLAETAFRNIVIAIVIDRKIRPNEEPFLEQARRLLGLSAERAGQLILRVQEEPREIAVPSAADDRAACFDLMVAACKADGMIHPREEDLLRSIAPQFGVDAAGLRQRLSGVKREMR